MIDLTDYISRAQLTTVLLLIVVLLMYIASKKPHKSRKQGR